MKRTENLNLPIYDNPESDIFKINDVNNAHEAIDKQYKELKDIKEAIESTNPSANLQQQINDINASLEHIENEINSNFYVVKPNDNLQEVLNTKKHIYIPNTTEYTINSTLKTGMKGQYIKGSNTIIKNLTPITSNIRNKKSTLNIIHQDVTIEGLVLIGEQEYNTSTTIEDISTGHNFYISNLENANVVIKNCTAINGQNGFTCENNVSHVDIINCKSVNCEHGIQCFKSSFINIKGHNHSIYPYGRSLGYSQRSLKIQCGCNNITVDNCSLDGGRVATIYIRNEAMDNIPITNIMISNVKLSLATSNIENYKTFAGLYFQQEGAKYDNISINNISGENPIHGIRFSISDNKEIDNITINNINISVTDGRALSSDYGDGKNGNINNFTINNLIGKSIFIRGNGVISNCITNELIGYVGEVLISNCKNNSTKTLKEIYYINGVVGSDRVAFIGNANINNVILISAQRDNTGGSWVDMPCIVSPTGIVLDSNAIGRNYKLIIGVV